MPVESDGLEDEEGDGLEDEEDDDDDKGGSDSGEHNGDRSDGGVSIAATEQFEHNEDGDEAAAEGGGDGGGGGGDGEGQLQSLAKKTRVATYTLLDVPPALQRELDSFYEWRLKPINRDRDGVSVEAITVAGNRADALRLLGWLKSEKNIAPSVGSVFGSERLGWAVQAFVEHLRACGRTYTTCAGYTSNPSSPWRASCTPPASPARRKARA